MTAAMSIKTPVMVLPLLPPLPEPECRSPVDALSQADKGAALQNRLRRLSFAEILRSKNFSPLHSSSSLSGLYSVRRAHAHCSQQMKRELVIPRQLIVPTLAFAFPGIKIREVIDARTATRRYSVNLRIYPIGDYPPEAELDFPMVEAAYKATFVPRLRVRNMCCILLSSAPRESVVCTA